MNVIIHLTRRDPPAGNVELNPRAGRPTVSFSGWLGLLRALYDLLKGP